MKNKVYILNLIDEKKQKIEKNKKMVYIRIPLKRKPHVSGVVSLSVVVFNKLLINFSIYLKLNKQTKKKKKNQKVYRDTRIHKNLTRFYEKRTRMESDA